MVVNINWFSKGQREAQQMMVVCPGEKEAMSFLRGKTGVQENHD